MRTFEQLSEPAMQKIASGATYLLSGGLITVDLFDLVEVIDSHPGFVGAVLGLMTFLMNWYYQHKNSNKREGNSMVMRVEPVGGKAGWLLVLVLVVVFIVAGCSTVEERFEDGYQVGDLSGTALDLSHKVLERQAAYCAGADPMARGLLLAVARSIEPDFPEQGLCTDLFLLLVDGDDGTSR